MILGLGNDLTDINRIERLFRKFPVRFQQTLFTQEECVYALKHRFPATAFAKRFAAKEACAKALGVGLKVLGAKTTDGVLWKEIEVRLYSSGQPHLHLTGMALECLRALAPPRATPVVHVSLSDQYPYAFATVILSTTFSEREE
ncbi:MAG: holo-ACP synthase [Holosporales bacterium]|jgi:holo-[acyl-carrier protein] synthase|nr:holo-ACP synthase [Holosporales bacterium]